MPFNHIRSGDCADNKKIMLVCHDAGAANALAEFAIKSKSTCFEPIIVCADYACDVFQKADIPPDYMLDSSVKESEIDILFQEIRPDAVLLGTSSAFWVERWCCRKARADGIYGLSFVDWWSNFGQRFSSPGTLDLHYLPDEIAVLDNEAYRGCVKDGIRSDLLRVTGNPYWDRLVNMPQEIMVMTRDKIRNKLAVSDASRIGLLISGNMKNINPGIGYDEEDFFAAVLPLPEISKDGAPIKWFLKPHPKEHRNELESMLRKFSLPATILENLSGFEAIASADYVVGMCSSLLFEAALLRKKVLSVQPGLNKERLPHLKIFECIGVPIILRSNEIQNAVGSLIGGTISLPDLSHLPFPIGNDRSFEALSHLLENGIRNNIDITQNNNKTPIFSVQDRIALGRR